MPGYRYPQSNCMRQGMPGVRQQGRMTSPCMDPGPETTPVCNDTLSNLPVAMAYVPWSNWQNIYEIEKGFHRGTIFQNLDKPFRGAGGCQNARS